MKIHPVTGNAVRVIVIACLLGGLGSGALGQFLPDPILLDSFEGTTGISDWSDQADQTDYVGLAPGDPNVIYISHAQSNVGVTRGSNSLALELNSGSGWGVTLTANATDSDPTLYNGFNTVAQDPGAWFLEGDLTLDASSWANVSRTNPNVPPFQEIGLFQVNLALSDDGGFGQAAATADLYDQIVQVPLRVSANDLMFVPDSTFYQLFLGAANVFQPGGTAQAPLGAVAYFDNLRFTPAPPSAPVTMFSWETPPDGNGAEFEGWSDCGLGCGTNPPNPNHTGAHVHRVVTSPAATDGSHVLRIDNTRQNDTNLFPGFAFRWGTTFELDANIGSDETPVIDPQIKSRIDELREIINAASAFTFDLHMEDLFNDLATYDPFAPSPSFMRIALAIEDGTGSFFQAEGTAVSGLPDANPDDTFEYVIGTNIMTDVSSGLGILQEVGIEDTNFLRFNLAINANGGVLADIDNFRAIIPIDLSADFDNDGDVDTDDLAIWDGAYGSTDAGDADADGDTDGQDFAIWQETSGNDATQSIVAFSSSDLELLGLGSTAVPEPGGGLLTLLAGLTAGMLRPRRNTTA
jgi:hypothetical protein